MKKSRVSAPLRSPIPFAPVSNGEFVPRLETPRDAEAERRVLALADVEARRQGIGRREFLAGPTGMAAALLVLDQLYGCGGDGGPGYAVRRRTVAEPDQARALLTGDDFILDCQTHHVDAREGAAWVHTNEEYAQIFGMVSSQQSCGRTGALACLARETYLHEVFVTSDTTVAMLSGVPAVGDRNPLANEEIRATKEILDRAARSERLLAQCVVYPNDETGGREAVARTDAAMRVAGWKVYTTYDPARPRGGFWLDDQEHGLPFLEAVAASRVPIVFTHKGLPWPIWDAQYASPRDIGPAARQVPGVTLVVYHSGYDPSVAEGPYSPEGAGVDRLIKSCRDAGVGAGANVYAELGGTWFVLMQKPLEAAHVLGKLLVAFGPDRILWGTDALFLGTPQAQIAAFRAFEIPAALQEQHGYPALTAEVKRKILGLNAARLLGVDPDARRYEVTDAAFEEELRARRDHARLDPPALPAVHGPRTRRELFAYLLRRGRP